jgi:hypothetical protein
MWTVRSHIITGQRALPLSQHTQLTIFIGRVEDSMSLRLAWRSRSEAVDLEASGDADDAGSIFAGGEVAGLLGGPWAGPVGAVADEEARVEDLEQERGQGQVKILRGKSPP